jgi:XTP/dITP diphosphohydrolase
MTATQESSHATAGKFRLVLGTTNRNKIYELVGMLTEMWPKSLVDAGFASGANGCQLEAISPADVAGAKIEDVDETGTTAAENAAIKAQAYARACREWTLADDTVLVVDALGGAPGIHTARFAGPHASAAENRARLLAELDGVPLERRGAHFLCHLALADPTGAILATSEGCCQGRIRTASTGQEEFGYDPLFEIIEYRRSFAELGMASKSLLSHRGRAMQGMLPQLAGLIATDCAAVKR